MAERYVPRLKQQYLDEVRKQLMEQFCLQQCRCRCRRFEKIVLNMGVGEAIGDRKIVNRSADGACQKIAGQKAVITKARKAIATFKIRENMAIGAKVTLRKARM